MSDPLPKFDPARVSYTNPYSSYQKYRREGSIHMGAPLFLGGEDRCFVFSYSDISHALRSADLINDRMSFLSPEVQRQAANTTNPFSFLLQRWMLLVDPPDHARLRSLVNKSFTAKKIAYLKEKLRQTCVSLINDMKKEDEVDLIAKFASVIPLNIVFSILGLPSDQHEMIRRWSHTVADAIDVVMKPEAFGLATQYSEELIEYLNYLYKNTDALDQNGLVYELIQNQKLEGKIDLNELFSMVSLMLFAGQETTSDAIGNAIYALLRFPDQQAILRSEPEIITDAVSELLRYDASVHYAVIRIVKNQFEISGRTFNRGDEITAVLGSVHHDEARYTNPEQLDLRRVVVGGTLVFGRGIHTCIGMHLARMEMETMLLSLFQTLPNMKLCEDRVVRRANSTFHGLEKLIVAL